MKNRSVISRVTDSLGIAVVTSPERSMETFDPQVQYLAHHPWLEVVHAFQPRYAL
jgi:hypothetical protein